MTHRDPIDNSPPKSTTSRTCNRMFDESILSLMNGLDEQPVHHSRPHEHLEICATHLANRSSRRASPSIMNPHICF